MGVGALTVLMPVARVDDPEHVVSGPPFIHYCLLQIHRPHGAAPLPQPGEDLPLWQESSSRVQWPLPLYWSLGLLFGVPGWTHPSPMASLA